MIIYCARNLKNGKVYIGKTIKSLDERRLAHAEKCKRDDTAFYRALRKYGAEKFEWKVLQECVSEDELNKMEVYWIERLNANKFGYNLTSGGDGGCTYKRGDKTYKKIRHKLGKWKNGNPGATPEAIAKRVKSFELKTEWPFGSSHGNFKGGKGLSKRVSKYQGNVMTLAQIKQAKPVVIDGIEYNSLKHAQRELNVYAETIKRRCESKKFPEWNYK